MNSSNNSSTGTIYQIFDKFSIYGFSHETVVKVTRFLDENIAECDQYPLDASRILVQTTVFARRQRNSIVQVSTSYSRLLLQTNIGFAEYLKLGTILAVFCSSTSCRESHVSLTGCQIEMPFEPLDVSPLKLAIKVETIDHLTALVIFWCTSLRSLWLRRQFKIHQREILRFLTPIVVWMMGIEPTDALQCVRDAFLTIHCIAGDSTFDTNRSFLTAIFSYFRRNLFVLQHDKFSNASLPQRVFDDTAHVCECIEAILLSCEGNEEVVESIRIQAVQILRQWVSCERQRITEAIAGSDQGLVHNVDDVLVSRLLDCLRSTMFCLESFNAFDIKLASHCVECPLVLHSCCACVGESILTSTSTMDFLLSWVEVLDSEATVRFSVEKRRARFSSDCDGDRGGAEGGEVGCGSNDRDGVDTDRPDNHQYIERNPPLIVEPGRQGLDVGSSALKKMRYGELGLGAGSEGHMEEQADISIIREATSSHAIGVSSQSLRRPLYDSFDGE